MHLPEYISKNSMVFSLVLVIIYFPSGESNNLKNFFSYSSGDIFLIISPESKSLIKIAYPYVEIIFLQSLENTRYQGAFSYLRVFISLHELVS